MKRIAAVALLVSLGALQGCGGPEVETKTRPKLEIKDHRIDGIYRLKIAYNTEFEDRFQQFKRTAHEEHYIDFSTQIFRNNIAEINEHNGNERKSTFVEFIIDDLDYRIGQHEPDLCITSPFFSDRRPWAMNSFKSPFSKEFENEVIAGVECKVTGHTSEDRTWKRWKWNGIVLKEILEYSDVSEKIEAVALVINPDVEEGFFELPDHIEIITQQEYANQRRERMLQLLPPEEQEKIRQLEKEAELAQQKEYE